MPETRPEDLALLDSSNYFRLPHLVSSTHTGVPQMSEFHAHRLASGERPPCRTLRIGGFMDKKEQDGDDELIPEMLRLCNPDTYLSKSNSISPLLIQFGHWHLREEVRGRGDGGRETHRPKNESPICVVRVIKYNHLSPTHTHPWCLFKMS